MKNIFLPWWKLSKLNFQLAIYTWFHPPSWNILSLKTSILPQRANNVLEPLARDGGYLRFLILSECDTFSYMTTIKPLIKPSSSFMSTREVAASGDKTTKLYAWFSCFTTWTLDFVLMTIHEWVPEMKLCLKVLPHHCYPK